MKSKAKCPFCQNDFLKAHGNQVYCCSDCKGSQKAVTQAKLYGILKEFRKGFLWNYKLFEQLFTKTGSKTFKLADLTSQGFRPAC